MRRAASLGPVLAANTDLNVPAPGPALSVTRTFDNSIIWRYQLGSFGYGWSFQWDDYAVTDSVTGDVIIQQNGTPRVFTPQGDGTYRGTLADAATLSMVDGDYVLRETDGTVETSTRRLRTPVLPARRHWHPSWT